MPLTGSPGLHHRGVCKGGVLEGVASAVEAEEASGAAGVVTLVGPLHMAGAESVGQRRCLQLSGWGLTMDCSTGDGCCSRLWWQGGEESGLIMRFGGCCWPGPGQCAT